MIETKINQRWSLLLPEHRAARPQWETGWERERWDAICDDIRPGMVAYDIGVEEGDLTALMASWGAQIVMFEPNDRVWANVRAIWDANALPAPLGIWAGFAGSQTREPAPGMLWDGTLPGGWPDAAYGPIIGDHGFKQLNERPDIPEIRLDDYAARTGHVPDLITMDVEGSELHVLQGADWLLARIHPIVYVSVHPTFMLEQYQQSPEDLFAYMADHGYSGELLAEDHELHYRFAIR